MILRRKRTIVASLLALIAVGVATVAALAGSEGGTGASSSQSPYLVPSANGVEIRSIFTVGDPVGGTVDGYRMAGIPDGLGALKGRGGTFNALDESRDLVRKRRPVARRERRIRTRVDDRQERPVRVLLVVNQIRNIATWNTATGSYNAPATGIALSRLCSADLPDEGAFYDKRTKAGYVGPLFMHGEISGAQGPRIRAARSTAGATSFPALGRLSTPRTRSANPLHGQQRQS